MSDTQLMKPVKAHRHVGQAISIRGLREDINARTE